MVEEDLHITIRDSAWGPAFRISSVHCALMKLRTKTHRNVMTFRQFPELCDRKIKPAGIKDETNKLRWDGDALVINPAHCGSHRDPHFNCSIYP